ncbi:MAG TPA: fumarate reductase subunit C [Candidatus Competibacteraceae bacterium]|nr:fumarate reductase subunit C [Candidatus Competibacteraceae bacterium]MCP5132027.1 fumarate reductase subunit C [Gammaproteobacteria bacterium]HPF59818.1 fumarate reductase subunit C [Candidatus Competibacteraceae bacterium]HRY16867.1 fumarate reductase subunit C [Candidatus Competibacteraceae bacterium]
MSRKPYIREISKTNWFFSQPRYMRYMAREVTCIFILVYTILLVFALKNLAQGPEAYAEFLEALNSPLGILFNLAALVAAVYHSTSWFNVTPQAMPIQRGEEFVPGNIIVGAHYGGWVVISLIVLFLGV